ncbi:hypothetical protein Poli38472_013241 [Pythium oligandrum]|uniref:ubiquitinyl hydrolase 1 n=1 Tax=Pythium oligandrum TaxID=41045 RepID=A0A8K1F9L6_PYTOL|nr:hypothetical protein Poli38472_013241 [Pythium oligandrum]|eukprot:TMW55350.1 hypothetical protein Poli38472_013241 [Pythium oligandrum]
MANLTFMQLCVLEDKLERVISRSQANSLPSLAYFVEELTCQRPWECRNCPYWLVFEVEGRLQIRPEQHYIAEELIYNPGKVCQLNMGRGKTRVILPMLFLYHSYETRGKIARAHFLSPLLSETRQFMHRVLSAGVLRLPFIEQPFERQTELSLMDVLRMQEAVDDVKQFGGFQIIASEHRLSLELRRLELSLKDSSDDATNQEIIAALDKLLDDEQYINIFDESDAVLHHKYHLVYDIGDATELDGGTERWIVAEALLRVLVGTESPDFGTAWFAAFGVLEHCLEKRSRVNYGLPTPGTRPKSMAIPFTAADLRADRSEFCHPDVGIVLTLLSYYHVGLRDDEIRLAFEKLLRLDESEQTQYYREWYASVRAQISSDERTQLEKVEDVALDNPSQFTLLCKVYKYSMVVINFYLNQCVFPRDTKQYPRRLARIA